MIDPRVIDAIRETATDLGQPPDVASRIISWLEALSEGNEDLENRDDTKRRCELVYNAVIVSEADIIEEN